MAEEIEMGESAKKSFAQMYEDGNMKNGVGIEVDKLNPIEKRSPRKKLQQGTPKPC